MVSSSCIFEVSGEWVSCLENCPYDVFASSREGDDGLIVTLSLGTFPIVEGSAFRVCESVEGGLEEDTLEGLVAACGSSDGSGFSGLAQDRSEAGCGCKRIGRTEAAGGTDAGDEVCREHGPHPWQAKDEGRVRVAFKKRLEIAVDTVALGAGCQRLAGKVLDQLGPGLRAWHVDGLSFGQSNGVLSHGLGIPHAGIDLRQRADEMMRPGAAQLVRSGEKAQEDEAGLCLHVDAPFQRGKERGEKITQARKASGLIDNDFAAPTDEQANVDIDLGLDLDRPQVGAGSREIGDGCRIARIGLVLSAAHTLPRAVDRQARCMNDPHASFGQHRAQQRGTAAQQVEGDGYTFGVQHGQFADQRRDSFRIVPDGMAEDRPCVRADHAGPMNVLGGIDANVEVHGFLPEGSSLNWQPSHAVLALHSDQSQSLISGRVRCGDRADLPPEPSRAASMIAIPSLLPSNILGHKSRPAKEDVETLFIGRAA